MLHWGHAAQSGLEHCMNNLTVNVELTLPDRRVANANGARAFIPCQPWQFRSGNHFSPVMLYRICTCAGLPATARSSQSRQALASS